MTPSNPTFIYVWQCPDPEELRYQGGCLVYCDIGFGYGPNDAGTGCEWMCGNGLCQPSTGESCLNCPADCGASPNGIICKSFTPGDGICTEGESCLNPASAADCGVRCICGNNICSHGLETCVSCPSDCTVCAPYCGDGHCDSNEDCTCSDCTAECTPNDNKCGSFENCFNSPADCPVCSDQYGPWNQALPDSYDTPGWFVNPNCASALDICDGDSSKRWTTGCGVNDDKTCRDYWCGGCLSKGVCQYSYYQDIICHTILDPDTCDGDRNTAYTCPAAVAKNCVDVDISNGWRDVTCY